MHASRQRKWGGHSSFMQECSSGLLHMACGAKQAENIMHGAEYVPMRSTCCGVAHSSVNASAGICSAAGRKLKMPPPPLFTSTTVSGGRAPAQGLAYMIPLTAATWLQV
jgi:hypothetical protein